MYLWEACIFLVRNVDCYLADLVLTTIDDQEQDWLFGLSQLTATWLLIIGWLSRVTDYRPG